MYVRRVVTGHDNQRSVVVSDGPAPRTHDFRTIPGFSNTLVWSTDSDAPTGSGDSDGDPTLSATSMVAGPGGSRCLVIQLPPAGPPPEDPHHGAAIADEQRAHLPGLAERFEPDAPGFHTTPTLDYVFVVTGQVCLELDDGRRTLLAPGDVVVQRATRHAWINVGDEPAVLAAVMVGAPGDTASQPT